MKMVPLDSSHLSSVGHDRLTDTLHVSFKDQSVYAYQGVNEGLYMRLVGAGQPESSESAGTVFNTHVKGKFKSVRVAPPAPKPKPGP